MHLEVQTVFTTTIWTIPQTYFKC